jgi:predicted DNA-binding transcriptional regulator AlpA
MPQKAEGTPARTSRVYRFRDLKGAGVSYTRKHITDLEKRGEFPMHFQLGPNSIGWVAEEVDNWVEERIRRRVVPPRQVLRGNDPVVHNAVSK